MKIYQIYPWHQFINSCLVNFINHSNISNLNEIEYGVSGNFKILRSYIKSLIEDYNYKNPSEKTIIVDTCRPIFNWRNNDEIQEYSKYSVNNFKFSQGFEFLELFLDETFRKYQINSNKKDVKSLYFISVNNLDSIDITQTIKKTLGEDLFEERKNDSLIFDMNEVLYRDKRTDNIPNYVKLRVQTELKQNQLLM